MTQRAFVRAMSAGEQKSLRAHLQSSEAFTLRRSQILLASARGYPVPEIASVLGCRTATVLRAIHQFETEGLDCLSAKSTAPKRAHGIWPKDRDNELRDILHKSPRTFGKKRSVWTLELVAEVCFEVGLTPRRLSLQTISYHFDRLDINWKRAKLRIMSRDPDYEAKKARRARLLRLSAKHPEWVVGFEDEVWWSRVARPVLHNWTDGPAMKVRVLGQEKSDPDPVAIACYGFYRMDTRKVLVRFVEKRPLGDVTVQFLEWLCWGVAREGKKVLAVIWDDASWHTCETVAGWVDEQNRRARQGGGVKVVICELPVAAPWLNNIEPCWTHAKKAVVDTDRKLTAAEITRRVCEHFECEPLPYLKSASPHDGADIHRTP
jgi:transposase